MDVLVILILFIVISTFTRFIKKVPNNTALIIDRNTHYHKTVLHGFYTFNPRTDFVTTQISTSPTHVTYTNIFETHDSVFFNVTFSVSYKTSNVEKVLDSLKSSRRSIYDVINSTVDNEFFSFDAIGLRNSAVHEEIKRKLASNLSSFYIDFINFQTISIQSIYEETGRKMKFKKHISNGDSPIKFS